MQRHHLKKDMADILTRDDSVHADMRGIFDKMERRRASPIVASASSGQLQVIPTASNRGWAVRIVAPAIVLLAFVATIALMLMPSSDRQQNPTSVAVASNAPAPAPAQRPVTVSAEIPAEVEAGPPIEPIAAAEVDRLPTPSPSREAAEAPREPRAAADSRDGGAADTDIAAAPDVRRNAAACWRDPDRCLYQDVLAADQRLVRAYQRARQAGVPARQMRDIRRRWDRALDGALDEPGEMIETYDGLADELDRTREQVGRPPA